MKILVINLERDVARRDAMRRQLAMFPFAFFPAVDGTAASFPRHNPKENVRWLGRALTAGELGCFASHYAIWEAVAAGDEAMIVMEDDVDVSPGFREAAALALAAVTEFGVIRLSALAVAPSDRLRDLPGGYWLERFARRIGGTQCYAINPGGARRLLTHAKRWCYPVDEYLDRFWLHGIDVVGLRPFPAQEAEGASSIGRRFDHRSKKDLNHLLFKLHAARNSLQRDLANARYVTTRGVRTLTAQQTRHPSSGKRRPPNGNAVDASQRGLRRVPYDAKFYESQAPDSLLSGRLLLPHVWKHLAAHSVLDFGCGVGGWLRAAQELGAIDVVGIDGPWVMSQNLAIPEASVITADLESDLPTLDRTFDLAMALETLEHLSPAAGARAIDWLCDHAPVILFSAALPGQGGTDHINEDWLSNWQLKFRDRGFVLVDAIRPAIWTDDRIPFWYRQNVVLFTKMGTVWSQLATTAGPVDIVHPVLLARQGARGRRPRLKDRIRRIGSRLRSLVGS